MTVAGFDSTGDQRPLLFVRGGQPAPSAWPMRWRPKTACNRELSPRMRSDLAWAPSLGPLWCCSSSAGLSARFLQAVTISWGKHILVLRARQYADEWRPGQPRAHDPAWTEQQLAWTLLQTSNQALRLKAQPYFLPSAFSFYCSCILSSCGIFKLRSHSPVWGQKR